MINVRKRTPMVAAMLTATLAFVPALAFAQSNRLIINRGGSQQTAVSLTPSSNVSIDAVTGNVVVDCAASPTDPSQCSDPLGAANLPPAFSLSAQNFSQPQLEGRYPANTTFSLTPVGLHADYEVCQRLSTGGSNTNWSGVLPAAAAASTSVLVSNPDTMYTFALRCFSAAGARTSSALSVQTAPGDPQPQGCPADWSGQPWANFTRSPERRFTDIRAQPGPGNVGNFPRLQQLAIIAANVRQYVSVEFQASDSQNFADMLKSLNWIENQGNGAGSAIVSQVYFTISRCEGDFRLPANTPDSVDPTLNFGCRNIALAGTQRFITSGIEYVLNEAPNNQRCALAQGGRYYLNFMTVNPLDGYQPNEHNCLDTALPRCGVAFQSQ